MNTLCGHKIDRVVLHKDLEKEIGLTTGRVFSNELPIFIARYQQAYGPPIFEDEWLVVFSTTTECLADGTPNSNPDLPKPSKASS